MYKKCVYKLMFWAFVVFVSLPFMLMPVLGSSFDSKAENREAAPPVKLSIKELAKFPKAYESYFNDNFALRNELVSLNVALRYELLHTSPVGRVFVGNDGWLYLNDEGNLDLIHQSGRYREEDAQRISDKIIAYDNYFSENGIDFVLVLPPGKPSVYPEYIKGVDQSTTEYSRLNQIEEIIEEVDFQGCYTSLKKSIIENKQNNLLYYKTDTHWNYRGVYLGYQQVIQAMNNSGICDVTPAELTFSRTSGVTDLIAMLHLAGNTAYLEQFDIPSAIAAPAQQYEDPELRQLIAEHIPSIDVRFYKNSGENVCDKTILVLHDSYYGYNARDLIASNFSNSIFIFGYGHDESLIEQIDPDIVLYEFAERYIHAILLD